MARIVHGYHLTRKKSHRVTTFLFILIITIIVLVIGFYSGNSFSTLLSALGLSVFRLTIAYLLSLVVAIIVAMLIGESKIGDALIPFFDLLQNVPSFAFIPLFALWFGYTNFMVIIFAATGIVWPILFYMLNALKIENKDKADAAKIFGATGWKKILYFSLPITFPAMITGSIVGYSIGWEAVMGVEIIGLSNGIGPFLSHSVSGSNKILILGLSAILLIVFLINRLIWMPLLKKSQLYAD